MHHQGSLTANKPLPRLRTLESPSEARTAAQGLTGVTLLAIATVALYVTVRGPIPTGPIPTGPIPTPGRSLPRADPYQGWSFLCGIRYEARAP